MAYVVFLMCALQYRHTNLFVCPAWCKDSLTDFMHNAYASSKSLHHLKRLSELSFISNDFVLYVSSAHTILFLLKYFSDEKRSHPFIILYFFHIILSFSLEVSGLYSTISLAVRTRLQLEELMPSSNSTTSSKAELGYDSSVFNCQDVTCFNQFPRFLCVYL